jgi:hypothetical protein
MPQGIHASSVSRCKAASIGEPKWLSCVWVSRVSLVSGNILRLEHPAIHENPGEIRRLHEGTQGILEDSGTDLRVIN